MDILAGREIIFEFRVAGSAAQVCAMDCATGLEAFVTTPANAMRVDQQNLALRKLAKMLVDQGVIAAPVMRQENSGLQNRVPLSKKPGFSA